MSILVSILVAMAIIYVIHLTCTSKEIKVVPCKFKIKITSRGDVALYTLHTFEKLVWFIHFYKMVGEEITDPIWGESIRFIGYKFNSIEDAEAYYHLIHKK